MQKNLFDIYFKASKCTADIKSVVISSVYQSSKWFNSVEEGAGTLRYFLQSLFWFQS